MKTFVSVFMVLLLICVATANADVTVEQRATKITVSSGCAGGVCFDGPVASAVKKTVVVTGKVVTAPVVYLHRHKPVRRFFFPRYRRVVERRIVVEHR